MRKTIIMGILLCALGCASGDTTTAPPPGTAGRAFWTLQLNHHAVTLSTIAPYDTVQLAATPLSPTGAPLASGSSPMGSDRTPITFTVINQDTSVKIDSTGRVTAESVEDGVQIVASQTIGGVTLTDTAVLNITDTTPAPRLTTFSIQPLPGDSAKVDCSGFFTKTLPTKVLDATGTMIPDVVVHYWSTDSTIATIDQQGNVVGVKPGQVMLYAETDVYGIARTDSVRFTIGNRLVATVNILEIAPVGQAQPQMQFDAGTVTIGVGGTVVWHIVALSALSPSPTIDVLFEDSTEVQAAQPIKLLYFFTLNPNGSGNIPLFAYDTTGGGSILSHLSSGYRSRAFPREGTYPYHSSVSMSRGIIQVQ